jgi:hypothetical protein
VVTANAMIQPSQMYEVTVVGLEVQVPRTNSYILHPCDLRVSITHHLPTKVLFLFVSYSIGQHQRSYCANKGKEGFVRH